MTAPTKTTGPWVPDLNSFGARLALVRQKMGWGNVAEAARECGLDRESWRLWEQTGREPRRFISIAMAISARTGVDLDWLVYGPSRAGQQVSSRYLSTDPLAPRVVAPIGRQDDMRVSHGDGRRRPTGRRPNGRSAPQRPTSTDADRPVSQPAHTG